MAKHDTLEFRPNCSVPGCNKPAAQTQAKHLPSYPSWRRSHWIYDVYPEVDAAEPFCCDSCHRANTARVNGVSSASELTKRRTAEAKSRGFSSIKAMQEYDAYEMARQHGFSKSRYFAANNNTRLAMQHGFTNYTDYSNSAHPYRYIMVDIKFCQNHDGRCGFPCSGGPRRTDWLPAQLQTDHIDGYHENNERENLHVLCSNCHDYKSLLFKDQLNWNEKPDFVYDMIRKLRQINADEINATKSQFVLDFG
jgi:hypothetical protein